MLPFFDIFIFKDKKVVIGVKKVLSDDAGYDGYNPLTKEIYIDLCAGVFHNQKNIPNFLMKIL